MTTDKKDVSDAYALKTPEESRKLYADWADSYDAEFAGETDYILHIETARAFADAGGTGPVLDVGAGTGLCGAVLADLGIGPIDAMDISPEMLRQAEHKQIYRDLFVADLTQPLPTPAPHYAGVISSGTFTTGHVGPAAIAPLLASAKSGAQFALSINAKHYLSAGFADALTQLEANIRDLTLKDVPIYSPASSSAQKDDRAYVALFRKG